MRFLFLFWILPLISGAMWLGMLLAMLLDWVVNGRPFYPSMSPGQNMAYISDVGAGALKPLFITGCVITTIFLDLAFIAERWLRHKAILAPNHETTEKVLSVLSIFFAVVGTCGLVLLSIFDTLRHPKIHRLFLLLFMGGYVVSAIFTCWEYQRLGIHYRDHRVLRLSFWIKLFFILVEFAMAVGFGYCLYKHIRNPGAVLEWTISFVFTFYILSFFVDLYPAGRKQYVKRPPGTRAEMGMADDYAHANGNETSSNGHVLHNGGHGMTTSGITSRSNGYVVPETDKALPPQNF